MISPERAPLGAALAVLLTLVALTGGLAPTLTAAVIAVGALMVAIGWPELLELPSVLGTRLVVGGTGVLGAAAALLSSGRLSPLSGVLLVAALGVFASFVHQMCRRERHRLTVSLTGTVAGTMLTALSSCWVLAADQAAADGRLGVLVVIGAVLAVSLLVDASPLPALWRFLAAIAAGIAIAAVLAMPLAGTGALLGAVLGAVVAVSAAGTHVLLGSLIVSREPGPALAVAAAPVLTVGVVAQLAVALLPA